FLREYFRQRHGIPELPLPQTFEGGYTDIFFTGVARNVWHCDVASLYPSIMLQFDCFPQSDRLEIFRHLLTDLRTFRLENTAAICKKVWRKNCRRELKSNLMSSSRQCSATRRRITRF